MKLEPGQRLQVAFTGDGTEIRIEQEIGPGMSRIVAKLLVLTKEQHVEIWRQLGTSYATAETEIGAAWLDLHAAKEEMLRMAEKLSAAADALPANKFVKDDDVGRAMEARAAT